MAATQRSISKSSLINFVALLLLFAMVFLLQHASGKGTLFVSSPRPTVIQRAVIPLPLPTTAPGEPTAIPAALPEAPPVAATAPIAPAAMATTAPEAPTTPAPAAAPAEAPAAPPAAAPVAAIAPTTLAPSVPVAAPPPPPAEAAAAPKAPAASRTTAHRIASRKAASSLGGHEADRLFPVDELDNEAARQSYLASTRVPGKRSSAAAGTCTPPEKQ